MHSTLCTAINEKRVIRFWYDDDIRRVEPFCYGESTTGKDVLRGYQIGGGSESNTLGWKLFDVALIEHLSITDDTFSGRRPHYNPHDKAMVRIYCRVPKQP